MLENISPESPAALSEPLLGGRAVAVIVGMGVALFGASVPLVGWEQALGSLLAAFAGLLLAVALAEPLVHRLQGIIEARNVTARQRAVAVDVLRVVRSSVWSLAKVAIPNWEGRKLPDQVDAGAVLKILDEAEGRLRDAETRALAGSGGWIRPDLSDEEAVEVGLPGAWDRWWCADAIALSLEPVRYELSGRGHAVGVEEQIAQAFGRSASPSNPRGSSRPTRGRRRCPVTSLNRRKRELSPAQWCTTR